jgi:hypothetical protein
MYEHLGGWSSRGLRIIVLALNIVLFVSSGAMAGFYLITSLPFVGDVVLSDIVIVFTATVATFAVIFQLSIAIVIYTIFNSKNSLKIHHKLKVSKAYNMVMG